MTTVSHPYIVNMGPQHPSTHGVLRLRLVLDGETIVEAEPILGYLHSSKEKLFEGHTYLQCVPVTDRMDYLASMSNNLGICVAMEKLAGIEVPERAQYIRVIMAELGRLASHCFAQGTLINDMGAWHTPLMYFLRERETILDIFESVCGARLTYNYMRPGGVSQDLPASFFPAVNSFLDALPGRLDEIQEMLWDNEIILARTTNIGVLPREAAINAGVSGPTLRGSGVPWDLRKSAPYAAYDRFDFNVPVGQNGDCLDRFKVRFEEMRESIKILRQAIDGLPPGRWKAETPMILRPPAGDAYAQIESPRGMLGFYIVSDGGASPWRCHVRAPSFINLTPLRDMLVGHRVADAVVIIGSIDIVMGEVDR